MEKEEGWGSSWEVDVAVGRWHISGSHGQVGRVDRWRWQGSLEDQDCPSQATQRTMGPEDDDLGRPVRCVLPLGNGRLIHLVVACGFQGADDDAEKLSFTDQLFDAALCELAVVSTDQPRVIAGDFNVEPTKVICLIKVSRLGSGLICKEFGLWLLELSRMLPASGTGLALGELGGTLFWAVPLAAAALGGCWVACSRWIQPHLSVIASFVAGRWSAKVTQPVRFSPLWPAS